MAKKAGRYDPQLREVHGILRKTRNTLVLRWRMPLLQKRLEKLKAIQAERGGGLFGMNITPEIDFLEAAIRIKQAGWS